MAVVGKPIDRIDRRLLYVTQLDNWLKIKVIEGEVLQVVEPPAEKAFQFLSRFIFKGLERNVFALFKQPLPGSQGPHGRKRQDENEGLDPFGQIYPAAFQVEAPRLESGKQGLDLPSVLINVSQTLGLGGTADDEVVPVG